MRILLGQVLPSCPAPQNPQNAIQHATALDPRTATLAVLARFGKQGSDFLPLHFRQQRTRPGHRPSFGAADFAYLSSEKTQLPSFQEPVLGYATASRHFRPFVSRIHPAIHTRVRYLLQLPLAVGIPAESLNAVDNPDFILCLSRRLLIARAPGKTLHSYKIAHAICQKLRFFS